MNAEEVFRAMKSSLDSLDRKEKMRLCHRILPGLQLVYQRRKRGIIKSTKEIKEKLRKEAALAIEQENNQFRKL